MKIARRIILTVLLFAMTTKDIASKNNENKIDNSKFQLESTLVATSLWCCAEGESLAFIRSLPSNQWSMCWLWMPPPMTKTINPTRLGSYCGGILNSHISSNVISMIHDDGELFAKLRIERNTNDYGLKAEFILPIRTTKRLFFYNIYSAENITNNFEVKNHETAKNKGVWCARDSTKKGKESLIIIEFLSDSKLSICNVVFEDNYINYSIGMTATYIIKENKVLVAMKDKPLILVNEKNYMTMKTGNKRLNFINVGVCNVDPKIRNRPEDNMLFIGDVIKGYGVVFGHIICTAIFSNYDYNEDEKGTVKVDKENRGRE